MKTKAYKLRERIARYIYHRLKFYGFDTTVMWDGKYSRWFLANNLVDPSNIQLMNYRRACQLTDKLLGIEIFYADGKDYLYPILWNKEKERKYTEIPTVHSKIWHDESRNYFALWKGR